MRIVVKTFSHSRYGTLRGLTYSISSHQVLRVQWHLQHVSLATELHCARLKSDYLTHCHESMLSGELKRYVVESGPVTKKNFFKNLVLPN